MKSKEEKTEYDRRRYKAIKDGVWKFNPDPPKELSTVQSQVLEGSMLGDGSLYFYKNHVNAGLSLGRASKDRDYLQFEYDIFKNFCPSAIKDTSQLDKRTGKTYYKSYFRTQLAEVFTRERNRWYPNGTKIVPKDVNISPLCCAIWFCDDGSIIQYGKHKNRLLLSIATDCFTKEDVEFLCKKLQSSIGIDIKVSRKINNYVLRGNHDAAVRFIEYITPSFPPGMQRKSDKWKGLL